MEAKANHRVDVVRVGEPRVHPNADALELLDVNGYQVVTKKGQFKFGDLAVYVQPDSVVPQTEPFRFIWETYVGIDGTVPERRRRITVRKFRKEWSEGLLLTAAEFNGQLTECREGDDIAALLGITHYDPDKGKELAGDNEKFGKRKSGYPRSLKGWFYFLLYKIGINLNGNTHGFDNEDGLEMPVYDVDALKNYKNALELGELVEVTEKIHGSNARFVYRDEHMYAGSRTQWKATGANCIWRSVLNQQPWIEEWCRKHEGYGLYGEVTPTQGDNFKYGSDKPNLFVFDIRTPDGKWMDDCDITPEMSAGLNWAPLLYSGPYDYDLIVEKYLDGQTNVPGAKGIREGVVICPLKGRHVRGLGRLILKIISNAYLEKERD